MHSVLVRLDDTIELYDPKKPFNLPDTSVELRDIELEEPTNL